MGSFQPSAWARSWLEDTEATPELIARDPILTIRDKLWVMRQRGGGTPDTSAAVWSADQHRSAADTSA